MESTAEHLPSVYETPTFCPSTREREGERNTLMIKNNLLFPWEEKESGGKLFLGVDVTLNPKLVYLEDWRAERRRGQVPSPAPHCGKPK